MERALRTIIKKRKEKKCKQRGKYIENTRNRKTEYGTGLPF